ncbi:MAG: flagellar filament capping protein FliD, partial [Planctomycetota bacterium]|nr:flagellar filament capping protein FliD [Planctomycetota bacterium]
MALSSTGIRFDGLSSGIDYTSLITKLLAIERRPSEMLAQQITTATNKKNALAGLSARLLSMQLSAAVLARPSFFSTTKTTSSNESALVASGTSIQNTGAYSFSIKRLAQSHQMVSAGFASKTAPIGTGTLRLELGNGYLDRPQYLDTLNGGEGVARGSIRLFDGSNWATIDLSGAVTVQDVIKSINEAQSNVKVSACADSFALHNSSGGAIVVENVGSATTATDLGIAGSAAAGQNLYGQSVNSVSGASLLSTLNDGVGVRINTGLGVADFSISLKDGSAYNIDLSESDTTLQQVIDKINAAGPGIQASLSQDGNGLVLKDVTGANLNPLTVTALNSSNAAWDLGLYGVNAELEGTGAEDAANGTMLVGRRLVSALDSVLRTTLNGGTFLYNETVQDDFIGVRDGVMRIRDRANQTVDLRLDARFAASTTGAIAQGATSLTVASAEGFHVGSRLRISGGATEYKTITSVAFNGVDYTISFAEAVSTPGGFAAGSTAYALNESLSDITRAINNNGVVGVSASYSSSANGLRLLDTTGSTVTSLDVSNVSGNAGTDLGIVGNAGTSNSLVGSDLNPVYIHQNTKLSTLNGGAGVYAGKFTVIDRSSISFTVDLSQSTDDTIGDVVRDFNGAASLVGSSARMRVNDAGNGLIIIDSGPGSGTLSVTDLDGGSTARDLNVRGTAGSTTPGQINGSYEFVFNISATDSLTSLAAAINAKHMGATAMVVSDGSPTAPYRLSLSSQHAGLQGRTTASSSLAGLAFTTTMAAQDAVVLYGSGSGGATPFAVTSSENTISDIVPGMTLQLKQAGTGPVTVTVDRDIDAIIEQAAKLVEGYNAVVDHIKENSSFDSETYAKGILFGDATVRSVERTLRDTIARSVPGIPTGEWNTFASIGIKLTSTGKLTFDESKLRSALESDPDAVSTLFTKQRPVTLDTKLSDLNDGRGVANGLGNDFKITRRDGVTLNVDIDGDVTVADVLNTINSHAGNGDGLLVASLSSEGFSIVLTDSSAQVGVNVLAVTVLNNSRAANDLGIAKTSSAGENVLSGNPVSLKNDYGLAVWMAEKLDSIAVDEEGLIGSRTRTLDDRIESLNKSIEKNEERVKRVEEKLVREFANLEKFLSQQQSIMAQVNQL